MKKGQFTWSWQEDNLYDNVTICCPNCGTKFKKEYVSYDFDDVEDSDFAICPTCNRKYVIVCSYSLKEIR